MDVTWVCGGNVSWVQVRIATDERGARFTLEHPTPRDDASEDQWRQYGPGATGVAWDLALLGLALHLDRGGEPIDPNESTAWMASEDGKEFVRTASRLWPPRRGARPVLSFDREDAELPFVTASHAMWKTFEPTLRERLSELEESATTADRVA